MFSGNHQLLPATTASAPAVDLFAQSLAEKHYTILGRIARGGFGVVYKAIDNKLNRLVALKCALMEGTTEELEAEYSYQRMVAHENVAKVYELFKCENGQDVMAVEYADGGTLTDQFIQDPRPFPEDQARTLFKQVVQGVAHLHSIGMAHRDIKPDNILIFDGVLKISDFGLSCWADTRDSFDERNRRVGTQEYAAPEMFDAHTPISDPRPADIYSLAQILCELLVGCTVYDLQESDLQVLSDDADDLLSLMLEEDPLRRITAQEILDHPWLSGCKEEKLIDYNRERQRFSLNVLCSSHVPIGYTESSPL